MYSKEEKSPSQVVHTGTCVQPSTPVTGAEPWTDTQDVYSFLLEKKFARERPTPNP